MGENVSNYFNEMVADSTQEEFERVCLELLSKTKDFSTLQDVKIEHNKICQAYDGTYQIDGYVEYFAFGVKIKTIVECKMYKSKIERKVVVELYEKIQSLGANKGIVMSTSGFQSGAQEFALVHGIALIQVVNGRLLNIQQSYKSDMELLLKRERRTPKYIPLMYDLKCQFPMYILHSNLGDLERFLIMENNEVCDG